MKKHFKAVFVKPHGSNVSYRWTIIIFIGMRSILLSAISVLFSFAVILANPLSWRLVSVDSARVEGAGWAQKRHLEQEGRQVLLHIFRRDAFGSVSLIDAPKWLPADGLESHLIEHGCVAGVNGGYYTPEFTPVGLLVIAGKRFNPPNRQKPSGVLHVAPDGALSLLNLKDFLNDEPPTAYALQSWPFLVEPGGEMGIRSANKRRHRRTAVALTESGNPILITTGPLTLFEFASLLQEESLVGFRTERALNLDGGPSTGFFAQTARGPWIQSVSLPVRSLVCVRPEAVGEGGGR